MYKALQWLLIDYRVKLNSLERYIRPFIMWSLPTISWALPDIILLVTHRSHTKWLLFPESGGLFHTPLKRWSGTLCSSFKMWFKISPLLGSLPWSQLPTPLSILTPCRSNILISVFPKRLNTIVISITFPLFSNYPLKYLPPLLDSELFGCKNMFYFPIYLASGRVPGIE